jgi:hypothetical protein
MNGTRIGVIWKYMSDEEKAELKEANKRGVSIAYFYSHMNGWTITGYPSWCEETAYCLWSDLMKINEGKVAEKLPEKSAEKAPIVYTPAEVQAIKDSIKHWTEDVGKLDWGLSRDREAHFCNIFGRTNCSCCRKFGCGACKRCPLESCRNCSAWGRAKDAFMGGNRPAFEVARQEIIDKLTKALPIEKAEPPEEITLPVEIERYCGLSISYGSEQGCALQGSMIKHDGTDYLIVSFGFEGTSDEYGQPIIFKKHPLDPVDQVYSVVRYGYYTIPVYAKSARCVKV